MQTCKAGHDWPRLDLEFGIELGTKGGFGAQHYTPLPHRLPRSTATSSTNVLSDAFVVHP